MNRFDIPSVITDMINKAMEIDLIDATDVLALGATHGSDLDGLVAEIVSYAYSNIHHNNDHDIMVPYSDSYHQMKQAASRMTKVEEVEITDELDVNRDYMARSQGCVYSKVIRDGSVQWVVYKPRL